jgi:hypothetical protein
MIIELSAEPYGPRDILCIRFPYNAILNRQLRSIPGLRWNSERRCWYLNYSETVKELLAQFLTYHNYAFACIDKRKARVKAVKKSFQFTLL